MKNNKKITLAAATFGIAALAMGGSTFAWFQVANTANVALEGTVVAVDDNLDIGFKTSTAVAGVAGLGLILDDDLTNGVDEFVYWAPQSVNAGIMDAVIAASGFTSGNELKPITSGSFVADDEILPFYARPEFDANRTDLHVPLTTQATKADYVGFTVMFRALTQALDPLEIEGVATPIYFDPATIVTASQGAEAALRVGFKTTYNSATVTNIINPTATLGGSTKVGGVMDLNGDGANDYTFPEYVLGELRPQREIAYGEFTTALVAGTDWSGTATAGGVVPTPFINTNFLAGGTATGVNAFISAGKAKTAAYTPFSTYFNDPAVADIEVDIPLTVTDGTSGLAEVEMMMWLEGWDPAAKNDIQEAKIGAAIAFIAPDLY